MKIVSRKEWGARAARPGRSKVAMTERTMVIYHHATGPDDVAGPDETIVQGIQRYHMDVRDWLDIGYNYLIGVGGDDDGVIYAGRGWELVGAHCEGKNREALGVCFIGDFRDGHDELTPAAKAAGAWLYQEACRRSGTTLKYTGHGLVPGQSTACPGDQVVRWLREGMPRQAPGEPGKPPEKPQEPREGDSDQERTARMVKALPTLQEGATGAPVKRVQALLNIGGVSPKVVVDGDYGRKTHAAVLGYQGSHGLERDGIVGTGQTWPSLLGVLR